MSDQIKKKKFPTAYGILMILTIFVSVLTYILPAGHYSYIGSDGAVVSAEDYGSYSGDKGNLTPIPGSFTQLERNPQGLGAIITAPIKGFLDASEVAIFVLVVGALLGIMTKTKAIDVGIASLMHNMKKRVPTLITILVILFSVGGTTYGMGEETIAFYPILLPIILAAGFDLMTGGAIILLGAGIGVLASLVNPFATGIASAMAGVSLGDGLIFRLVQYLIFTGITIIFIQNYAMRVKKSPSLSITHDQNKEINAFYQGNNSINEAVRATKAQKIILSIFGLSFAIMIYAVIPFNDLGITAIPTLGWWFTELSGLFLATAVLVGFIAKMSEEEIINGLIDGAKDVLGVVFIIGVARGLSVMMIEGQIIDTILAFSEGAVAGLPKVIYINGVYLLHILLSFFIPSSSGLATVSMPIMAPMADMAGVSRSLVITAYQSASGIVNLVSPTSGILMGALLLCRVSYDRFIKFVWPFITIILIATMIMLSIGATFTLG